MNDPQSRNSTPVLDYAAEEKTSPMRALGRIAIPALAVLGIAMIVLAFSDRGYREFATAGSILVGSVLISSALRDRR